MYGNCSFFLINRFFFKNKKKLKKNLLEFRDIVLNKGINKKKCFEIVYYCV